MNKLITVGLFAILSVASANETLVRVPLYKDNGHFSAHTDDYINLNNLQYKHVLDGMNAKLQEFEDSYLLRLDSVTVHRELVAKNVIKVNERFDPLEVLNDFTKECVSKHRYIIPTVEVTRTAITKCHEDYSKQVTVLLKEAVSTRNVLAGYITAYKQQVEKCGVDNNKSTSSYTLCVTAVTGKTNELVISNEKSFQIKIEAAECTAKANVRSAIDCSYTVEYRTHHLITEAEVLIDRCLLPDDKCKPCEDYTCSESFDVEANIKNQTTVNPFYGRTDSPKCIMLHVQ